MLLDVGARGEGGHRLPIVAPQQHPPELVVVPLCPVSDKVDDALRGHGENDHVPKPYVGAHTEARAAHRRRV